MNIPTLKDKMEKVKVNNQIVSMRKYVKQAKVHVINKLVKQVKLLQNRKGSDDQKLKAHRKAERFLETIAIMKKIKPDDVSKLALSKAQNWTEVLQQKNATLHDRCIAMLANYEAVRKEVEVFHNANKELASKIADFIKQWEEKKKIPKDSPKKKKMSSKKKATYQERKMSLQNRISGGDLENKLSTVKTPNESDDNLKNAEKCKSLNNEENVLEMIKSENSDSQVSPKEESDSDNDFDEHTKSQELVSEDNELEDEDSDGSDDEKSVNDEILPETGTVTNEVKESEKAATEVFRPEKIQKSPLKLTDKLLTVNNDPQNKLKAIAHLDLNELEGLDEIPVSNTCVNMESDVESDSEEEISQTSSNKINDPFFLGHDCDNSATEESVDPPANDNFISRNTSSAFNNRRTEGEKSNYFEKRKSLFSNNNHDFQNYSRTYRGSSEKFNNERNNHRQFKKGKFMPQNSHAGFQQKNKHNSAKMHFNSQDMKAKFEKNSSNMMLGKKFDHSRDFNRNWSDNLLERTKLSQKKVVPNDKPLHPSWEARKKQKELAMKTTSFQGKRKVFDD